MKSHNFKYIILKRVTLLLCICAVVFSLLSTTVNAVQPDNKPEKIKVGYVLIDNLMEGEPGQVKSGYGYEYLQMLRNYTGWEYEYVYSTWDEAISKLEAGEIDLISHVGRTAERENTMLFSLEPIGRETHYLYTCSKNFNVSANDYSTLNGKNIGVLKGNFRKMLFEEWCETHGIICNIIEYDDSQQMYEDAHNNKLDAINDSRFLINDADMDWRIVLRFNDAPVYFAINKRRPDIQEKINTAQREILEINENYGEELQYKYLSKRKKNVLKLTLEEKEFIDNNGTFVLGYCEDRRPLAYTDKSTGRLSGLLKDYLDAMETNYGMKFETVAYDTGIDMLAALLNGDVDIISPVGYDFGMAENSGVSVSNPITVESMVAVFKGYKGTEKKDIFKRIAVLENSITEKDYAKRFYPDAELVEAKDIGDAIELVDNGRAGCYIIRSSTWSWYKGEYPLLNDLQIVSLPDSNNVNMAIRTDMIQLLPILNKGINMLTETDVNRAIVAYSDAGKEVTFFTIMERNPIATVISVVAFILAMTVIFMVYKLKTEAKYTHRLEQAKETAEKAQMEAERANKAKSTFLTSMSHDIRTPMNAIIGMTTLASKHINSPDYVRNCLNKVTLASDHLLTLINDVLDINKIETGNLSLNPTVFSIADSIFNLGELYYQVQQI